MLNSVEKLRFGILGCGVIGPHHARAIAGLEDAELVAVANVVPELADKLAGEYGCSSHSGLGEMLSEAELDAVCVCTPSGMHAGDAIAALEAGKHVVIEKPVDVTLEAVDRLLGVQRATGGKVAVVSQHRFDAATLAVHRAISTEQFGRLTAGSAEVRWWRSQSYYDSGGWRGTWELDGGGVLINQAIHSIDLLQWLMGLSSRSMRTRVSSPTRGSRSKTPPWRSSSSMAAPLAPSWPRPLHTLALRPG